MSFCVETIVTDTRLRAEHGVLRQGALCVTNDAHANAQQIRQDTLDEVEQLLQQARQQASEITRQAELQALERMRNFMQAFDAQYAAFAERSQPLVIALATGLFDKLVLSLTERERICAVVQRLVLEAPAKLSEAMLHLHPSDIGQLPPPEWPVKADPDLTPGTALLVASSGEWRMEFDLAVATLKAALQHQPIAIAAAG